jgi:hypothetical protein
LLNTLHPEMTLRETLSALRTAEREPVSRFAIGSPCRFVRSLDVAVHVVFPEAVEVFAPRLARYLRSTSPRWGRSWRSW